MSTTTTDAARRRIRNAGQDGYSRSPHRFYTPGLAMQDGFIAAYALALRDVKARLMDGYYAPDYPEFFADEIDLLARESGIDLEAKP